MKLFIAGHFLILSFIALGVGFWQKQIAIGVIAFVVLQAIGIFILFRNQKGSDNV